MNSMKIYKTVKTAPDKSVPISLRAYTLLQIKYHVLFHFSDTFISHQVFFSFNFCLCGFFIYLFLKGLQITLALKLKMEVCIHYHLQKGQSQG